VSTIKTIWLIFVFTILVSLSNLSGQTITPTQLLREAIIQDSEVPYQSNIDFIDSKAGRLPVIAGYQFRTESDELDISQQQYMVRFDLNSKRERSAYKNVLQSQKAIYQLEQQDLVIDRVKEQYKTLVDHYYAILEAELVNQKLVLLRDERSVIAKILSSSANVDVSRWLSIEEDIIETELDSISNQQNIRSLESLLRVNGKEVDYSSLITINKIEATALELMTYGNPSLQAIMAKAEGQKAIAELGLEEAEANKWLDFAQLQYQDKNNLSLQQEISIGTSINLPYSGNNRAKRNEATLKVLEREYQFNKEQEEQATTLATSFDQMTNSISEWKSYSRKIAEFNLQGSYDRYMSTPGISPLVLLDIRKSMLKFDSKIVDIKKDIYNEYLDIIFNAGALVSDSQINYLSDSFEKL